jgi:hypothetical protein
MRPVSAVFLLNVAEVSATLIGLFMVVAKTTVPTSCS